MRITIETDAGLTYSGMPATSSGTGSAGLLLQSSADTDAGAGDMADPGSDLSAAASPGQDGSNAGGPPDWLLQAVGATKARSAEIKVSNDLADDMATETADAAATGEDAGAGPA